MEKNKNLYLAIPTPENIEQNLTKPTMALPDLGRVFLGSLNLKLKDLGFVPEERFPDLIGKINSVFHSPFPLTCQGLGTFGRIRRMVLWAIFKESGDLLRLKKKVDEATREFVDPRLKDKNIFYPHLTLAEIVGSPSAKLSSEIQRHAKTNFGTFQVKSFDLYEAVDPDDEISESVPLHSRQLY
jgi:2'-5' RNA ligase